ncbi:type IV pilus modification protein PilV [Rugamonas apoptosis]|uniref:Type IV pilus modification protein PilV n=1 Tax=Rugamonas apoptosis TaxID=2758570 RepID=A0A7W2FBQ3_9BURK|nr:type IV pilus modification protein PilV [Rugamonas apoptosis]MBA5688776.1 type IV pilus modification protein PilV [Rugamonas apoptosis]
MKTIPLRRQAGVALLEVMLAVLLLGIGLLGTIGLQARAYSALSDASMRAEATMATEKLLGVMNADLPNVAAGSYVFDGVAAPSTALAPWVAETQTFIPGAKITVAVVGQNRRYQVDIAIRWKRKNGADENVHRVTSYIGF